MKEEFEVNEEELLEQMKQEALKSPHIRLELIVGENNKEMPFAKVEIEEASIHLVARAILALEKIIKELESRNPLVLLAESTLSIDEERSATIELNKDRGEKNE